MQLNGLLRARGKNHVSGSVFSESENKVGRDLSMRDGDGPP